jgi:hypothetical protein
MASAQCLICSQSNEALYDMPENEPAPQISDIVKVVNLQEDSVLVAKLSQQLPEGTKIKKIEVLIDGPGGGGCIIQVN